MFRRIFLTAAHASLITAAVAQVPSTAQVASRVFVGRIPCELGVVVELEADAKVPSQFLMKVGNTTYQLLPVDTTTGVIRLEDKKAGAVWLQLSNKSMLMNQKLGRRLADECMIPDQLTVANAMKLNPLPGLLDAPVPQASPTAQAASSAPAAQTATASPVVPPTAVETVPIPPPVATQ